MLLASGAHLIERLTAACPSAEGNVFATGDLAEVPEKSQIAPALHVVLVSYTPKEYIGPAIRWEESWAVAAVVKHAARKDRATALQSEAAPLVAEVINALSGWRFPLAQDVWAAAKIIPGPRPAFSETHAYFPICVGITVATG
jgi:hypothetical protein